MKVRRYRRRRSAKVLVYNPWNWDCELGDLMVNAGRLLRLERPSSWGAEQAGILYPRAVEPPEKGLYAAIIDGEVWWCKD